MFRGTVYRDMSTDDPDLPELLRTVPSSDGCDHAKTLQRSMSLVSIAPDDSGMPPTDQSTPQDMSVSEEELDWADQMKQESDDRSQADTRGLCFSIQTIYVLF